MKCKWQGLEKLPCLIIPADLSADYKACRGVEVKLEIWYQKEILKSVRKWKCMRGKLRNGKWDPIGQGGHVAVWSYSACALYSRCLGTLPGEVPDLKFQKQPSCPLSSFAHNGMCNSVLHLNSSEGWKSNSQEALRIHRPSLSVWQVAQTCCWWWLSEELDWCCERSLTDEPLRVFFTWDKLAFLFAANTELYIVIALHESISYNYPNT